MFDVDWKNMDIEGSMDWGIPLINMDYSAGRIFEAFGNWEAIRLDPDGTYKLEYLVNKQEYLNANRFNKVPNSQNNLFLDGSQTDVLHTFINLATENIKICKATLKSGNIRFNFSNVTGNSGVNYDIRITSNTVFNNDYSNFELKLSKANPIGNVSCSGLKMVTNDSQIDFVIKIIPTTGTLNGVRFYPVIELIDITSKDAEIEVLKEQTQTLSTTIPFSIFPKSTSLQALIYNPKLLLDVTNSFEGSTKVQITKMHLKAPTVIESLLLYDDPCFTIQENYDGIQDISQFIKKEIPINSPYDSLYVECISIAPVGKMTVFDNSVINVGMNLSIPFDINIEEAILTDTLDFGFTGLANLSFFDTITLRTAFSNSNPLSATAQIWLYDSKTKNTIDSLLNNPMSIKGAYNHIPTPYEIRYINITNNRINALQQADKLILYINFHTDGQHNTFRETNCLFARVGVRVQSSKK